MLTALTSRFSLFNLFSGILKTMEPLSPKTQIHILSNRLAAVEKRAESLQKEIGNIKQEIVLLKSTLAQQADNTEETVKKTKTRKQKSTILLDTLPEPKSKKPCIEETDGPNTKFTYTDNCYVVVYTDGACENNGATNAKAGIGVWFGDNHPLNISKPVTGRATNNTAEIQACIEALLLLQKQGIDYVKIVTDSQFTISCMTNWMARWKQNNWKTASGQPVKNKEDLQKLDSIIQTFRDVQWEHVKGHQGIEGNEQADILARAGATRYRK